MLRAEAKSSIVTKAVDELWSCFGEAAVSCAKGSYALRNTLLLRIACTDDFHEKTYTWDRFPRFQQPLLLLFI